MSVIPDASTGLLNIIPNESNTESEREVEIEIEYSCDSESSCESESERKKIPAYRKQLLKTLQSIKRLSNYAYGDSLYEFCLPRLNVPDVGPLNLPLYEHHVKAIIARCEQAPFGRGDETIIDTTVRNTWQLSPTEFTIENKHQWEAFVDKLAEKACFELGFNNAIIEKKLYKLLIYEQGGFFLPHKDSEKEKGMFASLIIVLPSDYEGGQLIIRHNGKEKEFDFGGLESTYTINYAAFYADCEHEVHTITRGHRLCLVYNIINTGRDSAPLPFDNTALVKKISDNFRLWESDPNGPIKLVYLLEHEYTDVGLSFSILKGRDRAIAQLMKQVQSNIDGMMVLANMKWDDKRLVYGENYYYYGTDLGSMALEPIVNVDDNRFGDEVWGVMAQDQVLNRKQFKSRRPQEAHYKATGNSGVKIDFQYQATGLVFCPKKNSSIMMRDLMGVLSK